MNIALKNARLWALLAGLSPLAAQAVIAPIAADTHLAPANAGATVGISISPTSKGLLRFDLSTLPAGVAPSDIAKATLVFFAKTVATGGKLQASPVLDNWDESTVTSSPAPNLGAALPGSATVSRGNNYFALDVTDLVLDWVANPASNKGLALAPALATPTTALTLDSKEAIQTSHPAYIEITLHGPAGPKGDQGIKGDKGDQGIQGVKGDKGDKGIQGAKGDKGDHGPQGAKGDQGIQGAKGDKGDQGVQGFTGSTGPAGPVNLTYNQYTFNAAGSTYNSSTLPCPSGQFVIGGGCGHRDNNSAQEDIVINYSGPEPSNPKGLWACRFTNNSSDSRAIRVYSICSSATTVTGPLVYSSSANTTNGVTVTSIPISVEGK